MRVPLALDGVDRIAGNPAILAFNHSSYADALVLAAILPGEPAFVAKKELAAQIFAGTFLRRLGTLFVERFDIAASLADTKKIAAEARQGRQLVFFPEGTFTRRPGLSGFFLGAFTIAAEADVPIVPAVLRGTRTMLRGDQWFPRWTPISVYVGAPIAPTGKDFASVLRLRDAVRHEILQHCGEPDLGELVKPTAG
jgi:1-acyl-sn-glycerol-3-phosphate acyltransferase